MYLETITRGKVIFSANHKYVYLETSRDLIVECFENILADYAGETIVICVERPGKRDSQLDETAGNEWVADDVHRILILDGAGVKELA